MTKEVEIILYRMSNKKLIAGFEGTEWAGDRDVPEASQALLDHLLSQPELHTTKIGKLRGDNVVVAQDIRQMLKRELGEEADD